MPRIWKSALSLSALCLALAANAQAGGTGSPAPAKATLTQVTVAPGPTMPSSEKPTGKKGKFIVTYEGSKFPGVDAVRRQMAQRGLVQAILNGAAEVAPLPYDVPVTFKDCEDTTQLAYWNPQTRDVTYCYDFLKTYMNGNSKVAKADAPLFKGVDKETVLYGTTIFTLMHEVGHAMINMYHIPTTGREEDSVDQFSTLALIDLDSVMPKNTPLNKRPSYYGLMGAYYMRQLTPEMDVLAELNKKVDVSRMLYGDVHSVGPQRFYDISCMVLGSNMDAYQPVLAAGVSQAEKIANAKPAEYKDKAKLLALMGKYDSLNLLPYERAIGCDDYYKQYDESWNTLINDYIINPRK